MSNALITIRHLAAIGLVAIAVWAFVSAGGAIVAGHWSYRAFYVLMAVLGTVGIITARRSDRADPTWRGVFAALGLVLGIGLAWFLIPFEAGDGALLALESDEVVSVEVGADHILMRPTGDAQSTGLIFQPGARVDARAYALVLRPLAEAGHPVVTVKQPLGVAFFASGFAATWAADHPETERWVVGGHSLGGVVAAQNASAENDLYDLVLWASVPASDISGAPLDAVSIYGTNDGLAAVADIEASQESLPPDATLVPIEGAIHSQFGTYGTQPGDGEPGISTSEAQRQIIAATLSFLAG